MNKIELTSAFIIGHDKIDCEHKELAAILNNMINAVALKNIKTCIEHWQEFVIKLDCHFKMEERLKKEFGFDHIEFDKIQSQNVMAQIKGFSENCKTLHDWEVCIEEIVHTLMPFILRSDLPFAEHLVNIGYNQSDLH